jgi:RHS repeat-associated protein
MMRRRHRTIGGIAVGLVAWLCTFAIQSAFPALGTPVQAASRATPNRFDPSSRAQSVPAAHPAPVTTTTGRRTPPSAVKPPIHVDARTVTIGLDPGTPVHLVSGDAAMRLDAPAGAVSASDVAAAGGSMSLRIRQVLPASGGSAGGSGVVSFGTYLLQVLDANGNVAPRGLRQPLGVQLSFSKRGAALDVRHAVAIVNAPLPPWVSLAPAPRAPARAGGRAAIGGGGSASAAARLGPMSTLPATVDARAQTLSATAIAPNGSTTFGFDTTAPVSTFGSPNLTEVDPSAGSLTLQQKLDLPAGPGGLTPPLALGYDSAAVSDQHDVAGAAPWVGEGWHLTLGAISWAERNIDDGCSNACESPAWNDTWQLVDGFGTQAELIPPSTGVSTYYDDNNVTAVTASPIGWHTAPETHARVVSFTSPNPLPGMGTAPPCFRVFLPSGIMEEFGCTPDSLQFYPQQFGSGPLDFMANWLVDLITDPSGNQIHVTYQADTESSIGLAYPRDAAMATVEYDSPGCHNAQAACTGSSWAPLMRANFQASHSVAHVSGASCAANGTQRCDDPVDLSASGGLGAPLVESTFVLNDALVQVRGSGTAAWNTLRDYRLAYDQSGPGTITDPFSGVPQSTAGRLLLTGLTQIGADGVTALPARTFGYTRQTQLYEDSVWAPAPATNCGPSWNNGQTFGQGCNLWSQSYEGDSYYLGSASNGLGLSQTFSWQDARNNTDGVPSGADLLNPFVCNTMQSTSPCDVTDDGSWSRIVLTQRADTVLRLSQAGQGGAQTSTPVTSTTTFNYRMAALDSYWGDVFDWDVLDFYNLRFMGFASATVTNPDGSTTVHQYPPTQGRGVYSETDPMEGTFCTPAGTCGVSPWWLPVNAEHGREIELDQYNPDGSLQQVTTTQYQAVCPPSGVAGDKAGNLVSELDPLNPVAVCDVAPTQVDHYLVNGGSRSTAPHVTTTFALDSFGRVTTATETSNDGGASPTTIVDRATYATTNTVSATATSAIGQYLLDLPTFQDLEDSAGNRSRCVSTSYDAAGRVTTSTTYTNCGTSANGFSPSGPIGAFHAYDASGNPVGANDPDATAGNTAHQGCTVGSTAFSACATYDGTFDALTTATSNALNQHSAISYQPPTAGTATGGFGLWPISTTDPNGQTATSTYDALGRPTGATLPGEGAGLTTSGTSYTVWCSGPAAQSPCLEVDHTQRLNGTATVTSRGFYDGLGRLVETRSPAPGGQDIVRYSFYDPSGRPAFQSVPYFVAANTGGPGVSAYSIPDSTQAGTTTTYDGLGRTTSTTDALSHRGTTAYSMVCGAAGTGDAACYQQVVAVDASGHQAGTLADALGRVDYEQRFTGASASTYAVYATTKYTFDVAGEMVQILHPDGATTTTYRYDMAGREISTTDPDVGTRTNAYDQDGNLVQSVDARGAAGTMFVGYDGLNRPLWHNTTNSPTGAYYTYAYDGTAGGNPGIGRLTGETFTNGSLSGSYGFTYDARGRQVGQTMTVGGATYPETTAYDDAGSVLAVTYPDGETVSVAYTSQGWLSGVSTRAGTTTTSLLSGAAYNALGAMTGASLGGGTYAFAATVNALGQATDVRTSTAGGTTLYEQSLTYTPAGNVATASTTLPGGTDNQAFCYDEQNRLIWAGSTGPPPCTVGAIAAGTLGAGQYAQSFTYDTLGRLASSPLGSYTYGSAAHVHAATAIGTGYTASYDAAGNMTCRAPSNATTCAGNSPTGAQLAYNNESQLVSWQGGGVTDRFLYDCQGQRVAQQVTRGGATTTTVYVGGLEAVTTSGSTTTTVTYYSAGGTRIAMAVNGAFSYLASDVLGSTSVALSASGGSTASQLFTPYGGVRYSSGVVPTDYGFTGQRVDATTGLSFYEARYYDPVAGQFVSADSITPGGGYDPWGLSRYAYTRGNPTSRTDPSGHDDFGGGDFSGGDFSGGDFGGGATAFDSFSNLDFGGVDLSQFGIGDLSGGGGNFNVLPGTDTGTAGGVSTAGIDFAGGGGASGGAGATGTFSTDAFGAGATPIDTFSNLDFGGADLSQFGIGPNVDNPLLSSSFQAGPTFNLPDDAIQHNTLFSELMGIVDMAAVIAPVEGLGRAAIAGFGSLFGGGAAATAPALDTVVFGSNPLYTEVADLAGYRVLSTPNWSLAVNDAFTSAAINDVKSGAAQIVFSNPALEAPAGSVFEREVQQIVGSGLRISPGGHFVVQP